MLFKQVKIDSLSNNKMIGNIKFVFGVTNNCGMPIDIVRDIRTMFEMSPAEIMHISFSYESAYSTETNEETDKTAGMHISIYNRNTGKLVRSYGMSVHQYEYSHHLMTFDYCNIENEENNVVFVYDNNLFENINGIQSIIDDSYAERFVDYVADMVESEYLISGLFCHKISDFRDKEHLSECLANGWF